MSSGGIIPDNFRQGSRAEHIAQYFFSEFCIAERALKENDFGIDLYCSLMSKSGSLGLTSTLFGVQIKSGDAQFKYNGDYISQWLKMINIPLFMCRANRDTLGIEIFSTWSINSLLSSETSFKEINFVETYSSDSTAESLKMPIVRDGIATIWMGPPIIKCTLNDIINGTIPKDEIRKVLEEWVLFDFLNYAKRHFGKTSYFGYTKWETNVSLSNSLRKWYKPHVFNIEQSKRAIHRILEDAVLIALNQGIENPFVKGITELLKNNTILDNSEMDLWHKEQLRIK